MHISAANLYNTKGKIPRTISFITHSLSTSKPAEMTSIFKAFVTLFAVCLLVAACECHRPCKHPKKTTNAGITTPSPVSPKTLKI